MTDLSLEAFFDKLLRENPWREHAACRGKPTGWWVPSTLGVELNEMHRVSISPKAKVLCASCPVCRECLACAIANDEHGCWGGTSRRERLRNAA